MARKNHFVSDYLVLLTFIIWVVIDMLSLFSEYSLLINLGCAIVLFGLFTQAIRTTLYKASRYRSMIQTMYLLVSISIIPTVILYSSGRVFDVQILTVFNIALSSQSLFYLLNCRKRLG